VKIFPFNTSLLVLFAFLLCGMQNAIAGDAPANNRVVVLDFRLHDLTDLPNAPTEVERVKQLSGFFKAHLAESGLELVPANENLRAELTKNDAAYLFERPATVAQLAKDSGADYVLVAIAMKPTYLFLYPRIKLISLATQEVVWGSYAQLESSAEDNNTTKRTATRLADKTIEFLKDN
jgi:hypothetical protein